jgi:uncharacterized protein YihD (DUF1040 family)
MRDLSRIDKILSELELLWKNNPDLRLTQLISWIGLKTNSNDLYYVEDDVILQSLKELTKNIDVKANVYKIIINEYIEEFITKVQKLYPDFKMYYHYLWDGDVWEIYHTDSTKIKDDEFQSNIDKSSRELFNHMDNFFINYRSTVIL